MQQPLDLCQVIPKTGPIFSLVAGAKNITGGRLYHSGLEGSQNSDEHDKGDASQLETG